MFIESTSLGILGAPVGAKCADLISLLPELIFFKVVACYKYLAPNGAIKTSA